MTRLGAWVGDVRYAARRMLRSPGFTMVAILSLALGIGANTAIFSLVNEVLLTEPPFTQPEELRELYTQGPGVEWSLFSYPDYRDLRDGTTDVFAGVSAARFVFAQTDTDAGVKMLTAQLVSGNYFGLAGIRAHVGRLIAEDDDVAEGAHPVAVLGYGYWERAYAADRGVVGREIMLNGRPYEILGVTQPEFQGNFRSLPPDFYAPIMMTNELNPAAVDQLEARSWQSIFVRARVRPGVGEPQVEAALQRVVDDLGAAHPNQWPADWGVTSVNTGDVILYPAIDRILVPAMGLLMGVVGLVLLIACANLASFLLARATDRRKEIAVRLAMGARRSSLVRQLLTETTLLAVLGGGAGVVLANAGLGALLRADLPLPVPINIDVQPDLTVLGFTLAVSVLAGFLFGLAPAIQATNPDLASTLKEESTGGGRPRKITLRNMLVVGQVAASLVLLIGASLFLRSLRASQSVDPGFGRDAAAVMSVVMPPTRYSERESEVLLRTIMDRVAEMPGVMAVGGIDRMHLDPLNSQTIGFNIDGIDPPSGRNYHSADRAAVTPGFFAASGIELVSGRNFADADGADAAPVAIVSQDFAERYWPREEPIGRIFRGTEDQEIRVVGVSANAKVRSLSEASSRVVYLPWSQSFGTSINIIASTRADAERLVLEMFNTGRAIDPELIVYGTKTMERHLAVRLLPAQLSAVLSVAFAILAATLACIGLYGVVSYAVSTKTREVGIRMSLGADTTSVVRMLLKQGLGMVLVGGVIGIGLAALASRLVSGFLYGVDALDPVAFTVAPGLLALVAFLSAWIPAQRASRIDPVRALRGN